MRSPLFETIWLLLAALRFFAEAASFEELSNGISNATHGFSSNRSAICVAGLVSVRVTATNTKITLGEPANQTVVTEIIQENFQTASTLASRTNGGPQSISSTFKIDTTFCIPSATPNTSVVQVLTHGIGLDKSYWDIETGYSYVDAAATAGYATVAYNRLGVGASDHPDPIQVVQAPVDVAILHGLTALLRAGKIGSNSFSKVIGVGHSYGSIVQLAQNANFPQDVDAAVLTGFTTNFEFLPYTVFANNPAIASQINPGSFGSLPNGYLVTDTAISFQLPFFRFPFFDPAVFEKQFNARNTYTIGQQLTLANIFAVASSYSGPVDIVVGQNDFPFCGGNCSVPSNQAVSTLAAVYPAAAKGSETYLVPNSGHLINAHYSAQQEFLQINNFLSSNGF